MESGILEFLVNQIGTQGIWFALALGMGWMFKKEIDRERVKSEEREERIRTESKERELTLINLLDKYNDQLGKNVEALERLEKNFETLNTKIDSLEKH